MAPTGKLANTIIVMIAAVTVVFFIVIPQQLDAGHRLVAQRVFVPERVQISGVGGRCSELMSPAPGQRRGAVGRRRSVKIRWFNARRRQRGRSIKGWRRHNAGQAWGRGVHLGDGEDLGRMEGAPVVGQSGGGVDGRRPVLVRHQGDHTLQHDDANQHRQRTSAMGPESGHPLNNDPY